MHIVTGEIVSIEERAEGRVGRMRVGAARIAVRLDLVPDARVGDTLIANAGVALQVVAPASDEKEI